VGEGNSNIVASSCTRANGRGVNVETAIKMGKKSTALKRSMNAHAVDFFSFVLPPAQHFAGTPTSFTACSLLRTRNPGDSPGAPPPDPPPQRPIPHLTIHPRPRLRTDLPPFHSPSPSSAICPPRTESQAAVRRSRRSHAPSPRPPETSSPARFWHPPCSPPSRGSPPGTHP